MIGLVSVAVAAAVGVCLVGYVGYYCRVILVYALRVLSTVLTIVRCSVFFAESPPPPRLPITMAHPLSASLHFAEWLVHLAAFIPSLTMAVLWRMLQMAPLVSFLGHNSRDPCGISKDQPIKPRTAAKLPSVKCMDCAKPTDHTIHCAKCRYLTCTSCFVAHVAECINNDQIAFVCVRCYQEIDASVLRTHLPPLLLAKMDRFKHLDALTSCPTCSGRLKQTGMSKRRMVCCGCGAVWCFKCREPFHLRSTCKPVS